MRHSSRGVQDDGVRSRDEAGDQLGVASTGRIVTNLVEEVVPQRSAYYKEAALQDASRPLAQEFLAIFCRADSTHPAEHPCKVLLRFEAAAHRDVQDTRLGCTQHFFRALPPMTQNTVMRALAG